MKWDTKLIIVIMLPVILASASCGNRRSPTGGEKDTVNPEVVAISPEPFSDISEGIIEITFSKPIDRQSVYTGERGIYIYPLISDMRYRWSDNTLRVEINEELKEDTNYYLTLSRSISDLRDNRLDKEYLYIFHTGKLAEHHVSGRIFYELEEDFGKEVTLNVLSADTVRIFNKKTRGDRFRIDYLNEEEHLIRAFIDKNENNRYDIGREPFDEAIIPLSDRSETHLHLEYFDDTKPEIKNVRSSFNNHILVQLNKAVSKLEDIEIVSADTLEHSPDILGYDFLEDYIEIITSQMDTLQYRLRLKNVEDDKDNIAELLEDEFTASTDRDTTYLHVERFKPRDGAVIETLNPVLRVFFTKHVFADDIDYKIIDTMSGKEVPSIVNSVNSREKMFIPSQSLSSRQTYKLIITTSTRDASDNPLEEKFELNFLPIKED